MSGADCRWFLSLYINSMPLIFAFRIVDCVLAMGVKVLFQIGLGEFSFLWGGGADKQRYSRSMGNSYWK
jgi:hypothetical protein